MEGTFFVSRSIFSRNFGSPYRGLNNGLLVPLADMLNHSRPRQTTWEYKEDQDAFVITAVTKLYKGDQVMDSYGRRDNRRFLYCYGFVEDDNMDGNGCSPNTVAIAILHRHPSIMNGCSRPVDGVTQSTEETLLDEDVDCAFFWNSIVLDVMDQVDSGTDETPDMPETLPSIDDEDLGSQVSYRTQWLLKNSQVLMGACFTYDYDTHYDHKDSHYAYLSMCHDDAGTTSLLSIISFSFFSC